MGMTSPCASCNLCVSDFPPAWFRTSVRPIPRPGFGASGRRIWSLKQVRANVILELVVCYLLSGDADSRISCIAGATRGWPPSSAQQLFPLEVKTFILMGLGFRWPIFLACLKARCGVTTQRRSSNDRCNSFELISSGLPTLRLLF